MLAASVPGSDRAAGDRVDRLERMLAAGRALTSALGVLDDRRGGLAQFLTVGLGDEVREAIGDPPRGRGILGLLIDRAEPIRLHDISQHPRSHGFPLGHGRTKILFFYHP